MQVSLILNFISVSSSEDEYFWVESEDAHVSQMQCQSTLLYINAEIGIFFFLSKAEK
jgi:hypothetical protein